MKEETHDTEEDIVIDPIDGSDSDISVEESDEEGAELGGAQKIKQLRDKIKLLEKEKQEYLNGWQRTRADYANLVKNQEDEKKRLRAIITEGVIEEFLPTVDSFGMAFNNKEAWESVDKNWRTGIEYIYQQLMNVLTAHELHAFGIVGEPFDPSRHQAVSEIETNDETKDHTVASVLQQGFILKDSVLRAARVSVFVHKKENE